MSDSDSNRPWPTEINYHKKSRVLDVGFSTGESFSMSSEFLRVFSPSAEVRGHGPGQDVLQIAKENAQIERIEPIGNYAVRLCFSDGHDSGLYSWDELLRLGKNQTQLWDAYLQRLEAAGHKRSV